MTRLFLDPIRPRLLVQFDYRLDLVELIKKIPGRRWQRPYWVLPLTEQTVSDVELLFKPHGPVYKDPKLEQFLINKTVSDNQVLEWKQDDTALQLIPGTKFHIEPFKHQKVALALCQRRPFFALFMEMGTGKTKVIVDLLGNYYRDTSGLPPTVVVGPVAVINNWKRECATNQPHLRVAVAQGSQAKKLEAVQLAKNGLVDILVINYESFWRLAEELMFPMFAIVLDESTKIKHRATKQAKAIIKVSTRAARRYILTGTPTPNSPMELFNQVRFLDPTVFGASWYGFRDRYAIMGGYGGHEVLGWKNLDELTRKLAAISYRVMKKDCLDLPEKIFKEYRIPMDAAQAKIYKEMAQDLVTTIKGSEIMATVVLAKLTKLRQLASGFCYDDMGKAIPLDTNPKLNQLEQILPEISKGHKVVIWTSFREEMSMIGALCEKLKLGWARYDGTLDAKTRDAVVQEFQDPTGRYQIFVGQQHAGGLGITLTAADYCIFFSNDYSSEIRLQAEDRLHRIGQRNPVTYIDLITKGTVDSVIKRMLTQKVNLQEQILKHRFVEELQEDDGL